jgi:hypothetical protein
MYGVVRADLSGSFVGFCDFGCFVFYSLLFPVRHNCQLMSRETRCVAIISPLEYVSGGSPSAISAVLSVLVFCAWSVFASKPDRAVSLCCPAL